ncbi:MAG: TlpA family protein disulfide reductase [Nitrospinae bacterium]|nr:TlpA family protein disulfide reductase [Nitrospinota bacterium]
MKFLCDKTRTLLLLAALAAAFPFAFLACEKMEQAGEKPKPLVEVAPDFNLEGLDGGTVSMSGLKGSPVFLNFWASWCMPCREEMPDVEQIHRIYEKKGLKVFAVNSKEEAAAARKFLEGAGIHVPVLLDKKGEVGALYKIFGLPMSYFIYRDGKVASSIIGKMTYQDMDIHVNEIL